jgi:hypothetical protein
MLFTFVLLAFNGRKFRGIDFGGGFSANRGWSGGKRRAGEFASSPSVMKSNSLLMEEDSDLALDGACAATPAGVFWNAAGRFGGPFPPQPLTLWRLLARMPQKREAYPICG